MLPISASSVRAAHICVSNRQDSSFVGHRTARQMPRTAGHAAVVQEPALDPTARPLTSAPTPSDQAGAIPTGPDLAALRDRMDGLNRIDFAAQRKSHERNELSGLAFGYKAHSASHLESDKRAADHGRGAVGEKRTASATHDRPAAQNATEEAKRRAGAEKAAKAAQQQVSKKLRELYVGRALSRTHAATAWLAIMLSVEIACAPSF